MNSLAVKLLLRGTCLILYIISRIYRTGLGLGLTPTPTRCVSPDAIVNTMHQYKKGKIKQGEGEWDRSSDG